MRNAVWWAGVAALLPAAANLFYPILPLRPPDHWRVARAFADYYVHDFRQTYPRLVRAHPAVFYYLDVDPQDENRTVEWRKGFVPRPAPRDNARLGSNLQRAATPTTIAS